jgi:hypothetical protein
MAGEDRSGLLLGVALGSSAISADVGPSGGKTAQVDTSDEDGAAFSLRIGGAVGDRGALYFLSQSSATEAERGHNLTGIGASYYFSKSGPSIYLTGGLGFGMVTYADSTEPEGKGRAAMAGIGLELGWGLNVELNHMRVSTTPETETTVDGLDYEIASTQFMLGYTWF